MTSLAHSLHSSNVVGACYRVKKKIGEGSFGVIFEGFDVLNSQQVAIKFVTKNTKRILEAYSYIFRNLGRVMRLNYVTNIEHTNY